MSSQSLRNGEKKGNPNSTEGAYFNNTGEFSPKILADEVLQEIEIITTDDNLTMYFYDEESGIWLPNGETKAREIAKRKLGQFGMKHQVEEVIYHIRYSTLEKREIFEEPLFLIPCGNGILNINEMQLFPYNSTFHFLQKHPVNFNPEAKCPQIEKFLSEIVSAEDGAVLLELVGYCFWRNYFIQKAVMLIGEGSNGKSTYLKILEASVGKKNISDVGLSELNSNRFAPARLYGKCANIYADLPDQALTQTGYFKMMTGGDSMEVEKKFQESFNFTNFAKMIFSCNRLPMKNDESDAYYRRWILVKFPNSFEGREDKNLLQKLTTEEELSGLLNLAIASLKNLLKTESFSYSKTTLQLREEYTRLSDTVGAFVMDMLETSLEGYLQKEILFASYSQYCREKKCLVVSKDRFFKQLNQHVRVEDYRPVIDDRRVQCLKGISFKDYSVTPVNGVNPKMHTLLNYDTQDS